MRNIILIGIKIYQKTLSPDHGWLRLLRPMGYCRYYPTCSEYAHRVISKKGLFKGVLMSLWRIIRCNPLSTGGFDPPR